MTRAYLRLDPLYDERKADYPDGPYATFIACLCLGESQPERGRFRSERYLRALLDRRGKHVPYLLEHDDLVALEDGRIYIVGWDEWQEGDWKVTERVERIRNRRNAHVTPDVTVGVTPDVTVPVTADRKAVSGKRYAVSGGGDSGEDSDPIDTYNLLTARAPSKDVMDWLDRLADEYGEDATSKTMASTWKADPSIRTFLGTVETTLAKRAKVEAKTAAVKAESAELEYQRSLESMPIEERQANLARVGDLLRESGLLS